MPDVPPVFGPNDLTPLMLAVVIREFWHGGAERSTLCPGSIRLISAVTW